MGGLTGSHLRLEKGGFEVAEFDAIPNQSNDTPLQKVIRLSAGESVTPLQLAPHDMSYTVGTDRCFPCRLIRIMNAAAGTLRLTAHVDWIASHSESMDGRAALCRHVSTADGRRGASRRAS